MSDTMTAAALGEKLRETNINIPQRRDPWSFLFGFTAVLMGLLVVGAQLGLCHLTVDQVLLIALVPTLTYLALTWGVAIIHWAFILTICALAGVFLAAVIAVVLFVAALIDLTAWVWRQIKATK